MIAEGITIKGIREGLVVTLPDSCSSWREALDLLRARLDATPAFFKGARVGLVIGAWELSEDDIRAARDLLLRRDVALWALITEHVKTRQAAAHLGLDTRLPAREARPERAERVEPAPVAEPAGAESVGAESAGAESAVVEPAAVEPTPADLAAAESAAFIGPDYAETAMIVRRTLRSGTRLEHPGSIVILGDVHHGAEVIAGGDVIVWGKLQGMVHAGALGNDEAVVCALDLAPTQLRINRYITRSPDDRRRKAQPETGQVKGGRIEVVAWNPKK